MATDARRELQIVINADDNVSKDLQNITNNLGKLDTSAKSAGSSSNDMAKGVFMGTLAYQALATAVLATIRVVKDFATEGVVLSGQLRQNQATLLGLGENAGWTKDQIFGLITAIRAEGKDLLTATEITKVAIAANLSMAQGIDIVRAGRDVASASNKNSNDVIQGMITAVATLNPEMLKQYNILINQRVAYQEYADSIGKSVQQLSGQEKQQAILSAVMDQARQKQGAYEDAMGSWYKKANSVADLMKELKIVMGNMMDGAMKPIVDMTYSLLRAFNMWAMNSEGELNPALNSIRTTIGLLLMNIVELGGKMWALISEVFKPLVDAFKRANSDGDLLSRIVIGMSRAFEVGLYASRMFYNAISALIPVFINVGKLITEFANNTMQALKILGAFFAKIFDFIANTVNTVISAVSNKFREFGQKVLDYFSPVIDVFIVFGDILKQVWDRVKTFASNTWDRLKGLGDKLKTVFKGLWEGMTGKFSEAMDTFKSVADDKLGGADEAFVAFTTKASNSVNTLKADLSASFAGTGDAVDNLSNSFGAFKSQVESDFTVIKGMSAEIFNVESMQAEIDAMKINSSGFTESLTNDFADIQASEKDTADKSKDNTKEMASGWSKFGEAVSKVSGQIAEKMAESQEKITSLLKEASDQERGYNTSNNDWRQKMADNYLEQEKKVLDGQKEIDDKAKELFETKTEKLDSGSDIAGHNQKMDKLTEELAVLNETQAKEKESYLARQNLATVFANEIADGRRRASMTEFDRQIEDLNKERTNLEVSYRMKLQDIATEVSLEMDKRDALKKIQEKAKLDLQAFLLSNQKATIDSINKEIEKYNKLADAIAKARAGKQSEKLSTQDVNSSLATLGLQQKSMAPISLTITGNQFLDVNSSEKMGNYLMDVMKTNLKM